MKLRRFVRERPLAVSTSKTRDWEFFPVLFLIFVRGDGEGAGVLRLDDGTLQGSVVWGHDWEEL